MIYTTAPQDKLSSLGGHLWLHSAVASLADEEGGSFKRLCGGVPPAVPLWSLQLASAYHQSCLGQACRHLAAAHARSGAACSGVHAYACPFAMLGAVNDEQCF